ncbi:major facilitator superfamily-domain-containing protein [Collybia nuda]|uniref:Major facilitator superfamily-domain-containing protein n=1 Tax=Collybia nuda TaxID=64659 RepID=A0A9P5Y4E8_9AGAR|nr:major facilitator superfamily-domain-containing protein [Collybia nuda]
MPGFLGLKDVFVVIAVSGITTLNIFLSGALTVALPTLGKDLDFKQASHRADLQWPINVYSLSYGCMLLFFGRVGDIVGGRIMFLLGSAWFAAWQCFPFLSNYSYRSLGAAFAPNEETFIIFIALQGLGAAANTPSGIGLFVAHFPPGPSRNKAFGVLGAGQPIGFILGLVLGGFIVQSRATWRGIFYVQAALGSLFVLLGWFVISKDESHRRYTKGLDWGGALLSTVGIGLLTFSLADSASAPHGWASPHIIATLCASVAILLVFWYYERWREQKDFSVLMPPSMWSQPGARMTPVIMMVFFAWWSFNTLIYFSTLYYQQVLLLGPLATSIRFIPMVISGICTNVIGGWLMNRVPGQPLMVSGLIGNVVAPIIFALIDIHVSYWVMSFWVMILVVGADVVYPVGTLQISSAFDEKSQSLAGGIFNVATRLGTSLGIAITSAIATSVSQKYSTHHPPLSSTSPEALMIGFRAAGWTLFGAAIISITIGLLGLRGIGIVGRKREADSSDDVTLHNEPEKEDKMKEEQEDIASVAVISPVPEISS